MSDLPKRIFTIRYKDSTLVAVVTSDDLLVEEVCPVCKKQGVIYHLHPDTEEHKGSPHFKPWYEKDGG